MCYLEMLEDPLPFLLPLHKFRLRCWRKPTQPLEWSWISLSSSSLMEDNESASVHPH
ncbi:hypothetical protein SETIT_8G214500v2 [Setaria italica]|uniref:Uncharacterized protein n=1 Tax=Setaria italica TaxID=4555 RepID=A0A368SA67_SETIT|nr:hypothetical protein SETIT_8G214500v2 [Setaria italica]